MKNRLTKVQRSDGTYIELGGYDGMSNPTIISKYELCENGGGCELQAKQLTYSRNNRLMSYGDVIFGYDHNGTRVLKTQGSKKHVYYVDEVVILKEAITDTSTNSITNIYYYYDCTGICAFKLNNVMYHYIKDLTGNIIAIYNESGTLVARYVYDAWGNHKVYNPTQEDNNPLSVGNINPFRYKGYYYDVETNLFYVTSRYSPELCRWISPDSIEYLDPKSINGLNLYAYCGNDPVNKYDPTGHFALTATALVWIAFGVSAFVGATASVISQGIVTDWQNINVLQVIWDAGIAGIGGALSMSPLGRLAMFAANTALGFVGSVGGHLIQGHDLFGENAGEYWKDIGISTLIGAGIGLIGGPGAQRGMNLGALQQNLVSAYDDMIATSAKVASGYYKTVGMATIHMNKATARCGAAFLMYSSSYAKMLSSLTWSIYKSSVVTLGTSWRTAVM